MASYSVQINVADKWVDNFNAASMHLCMAKATRDGSGKEVFNVIAKTLDQIAPTMVVTWTEKYQIRASSQIFTKGAKIMGYTESLDIAFGETYHTKGWATVEKFQDSANVDNKSIGFSNDMAASIVLSMKDGDGWTPVYISPQQLPPGMTTLTPLPKVVFWFQQVVESTTMIATFHGKNIPVNPVAGAVSKVNYTEAGLWEVVPN